MKIKKYAHGIGMLVGACLQISLLNYFSIVSKQSLCSRLSPKIETREQAQNFLRTESARLGIPAEKQINLVLDKRKDGFSGTSKTGPNTYRIDLIPSNFTESALCHELYHISKRDVESWQNPKSRFVRNLRYFFIQEPQATSYQVKRVLFR
jgi:hypothetical protein